LIHLLLFVSKDLKKNAWFVLPFSKGQALRFDDLMKRPQRVFVVVVVYEQVLHFDSKALSLLLLKTDKR